LGQPFSDLINFNKIIHVSTPYGPHKITSVRQVAIPSDVLHAVGLAPGDNVHFRVSDHDPYVIEIVPSDIIDRRYQAGAASESLERMSQPLTPDDAALSGEQRGLTLDGPHVASE
jgi:bifunctional DNA-binding transcriptional regulator/antitoxin component of YhaV-PrlF toxin-antitoxin module